MVAEGVGAPAAHGGLPAAGAGEAAREGVLRPVDLAEARRGQGGFKVMFRGWPERLRKSELVLMVGGTRGEDQTLLMKVTFFRAS